MRFASHNQQEPIGSLLHQSGTPLRLWNAYAWTETSRVLEGPNSVEYLGPGPIGGVLYRPRGRRYPGAVRTHADRYVHGELYKLQDPAEALKVIDKLEGINES